MPARTRSERDMPVCPGTIWSKGRKWMRSRFHSRTLEYYDAIHTLGSAGMMVSGKKDTLFFTGDVCLHDQTILKSARFEDVQADVLIMETTRCNRDVPPGFKRGGEIERL